MFTKTSCTAYVEVTGRSSNPQREFDSMLIEDVVKAAPNLRNTDDLSKKLWQNV